MREVGTSLLRVT